MKKLSKPARITAIVLLLLTGINAIIAGFLFIADPSGQKMGMSASYLAHSPFSTFLLPGIILFFANGLLNIVVSILAIRKAKYYPSFIIFQGTILCGWIMIQVMMVRDLNMLHTSMLSIGIILVICGFISKKNV